MRDLTKTGVRIQIMAETLKTGESITRATREAGAWTMVVALLLGRVLQHRGVVLDVEDTLAWAGAIGSIGVWCAAKWKTSRIARITDKVLDRVEDRLTPDQREGLVFRSASGGSAANEIMKATTPEEDIEALLRQLKALRSRHEGGELS